MFRSPGHRTPPHLSPTSTGCRMTKRLHSAPSQKILALCAQTSEMLRGSIRNEVLHAFDRQTHTYTSPSPRDRQHCLAQEATHSFTCWESKTRRHPHTHTHTHTHTSYLRLHSQQRLADIIPDFDDAWHTRFNAVTSPKHRIPRARGIGELCH